MNRRERLLGVLYASPRVPEIDARKRRFNDLNAFISARGGWMTSIPGAHEVTFDALPGSPLPDQLAALGYDVTLIGTTERILPHQIVERFTRRADGELEPLAAGSTVPVAETRTHAGIVKTRHYKSDL